MKLEEYLQEKLNISETEATKLAEVFNDYKREHGHNHHHSHDNHDNHTDGNVEGAYSMISEAKETVISNNYDLDKIHCNGCPSNCSLSNPNCGRGKKASEEVLKMKDV